MQYLVLFFLTLAINIHCVSLGNLNKALFGVNATLLKKADPAKVRELWTTLSYLMEENIEKYKELKNDKLTKQKDLGIKNAAFQHAEESFEYAEIQKVNAIYAATVKREEKNNAGEVKQQAEKIFQQSEQALDTQGPELESELATLQQVKELLKPLGKKNVLIVVNMQNDYCKDCLPTTKKITHNKRATKLLPTANVINQLMMLSGNSDNKALFDLVVFTQDWFAAGTVPCWNGEKIPHCSSLVRGSEGAKVIQCLTDDVQKAKIESLHFTTENDDVFHSSGLAGETIKGKGHPTLKQVLEYKGFGPKHANLVIVGIHTDRSILKTATHAMFDGYSVYVVKNATSGGSVASHNWVNSANGKKCDTSNYLDSHICTTPSVERQCCPTECAGYAYIDAYSCGPPVECQECSDEEHKEWMRRIFIGNKDAPALNIAFSYMQTAGVNIFDTVEELHEHLVFL